MVFLPPVLQGSFDTVDGQDGQNESQRADNEEEGPTATQIHGRRPPRTVFWPIRL